MTVESEIMMNQMENFDAAYRRETELHKELEKVEIAYVKTVEKYEKYEDCRAFVEYLRTIEKVFTEAKWRNLDSEQSKTELIKTKIKLMANKGSIGEDVLNSIYDDFRKTGSDVGKICDAVNQLLEKYQDNAECREFILYLQYLYLNFHSAKQESLTLDELKERLIKARMDVLAGDGNPSLPVLEGICIEFRNLLKN